MTIGQEHVLLPGSMANPAFDYIALGHIHRHQVIAEAPPIVYAGSLDRLDFGDEAGEKGFYLVEIEPDNQTGKRSVSYEFHPVEGRRFITIKVDVQPQDTEPTRTVLEAIAERNIEGAIVRLQINLTQDIEKQIRDGDIKAALREASYFTIAKDIKRENRVRLGGQSLEEITPSQALQAWLNSTKVPAERAKILMDYGKELIGRTQ
jgi:exonuclease SbcD